MLQQSRRTDKAAGRGGGRRGGHRPENRETAISKKLSWLLRHGAKSVGLKMNSGGWANLDDVLAWNELRKLRTTFEEVKQVVLNNEKKRYQIAPCTAFVTGAEPTTDAPAVTELLTLNAEDADNPEKHLIRATQGHSMKDIQASDLLTPILAGDIPDTCPELVVHGTSLRAWTLIEKSGGLKKMGRQHIHFAARPPGLGEAVISGMRNDSQILIWVDVRRSVEELKWWMSANGVVLTDGLEGLVPLRFVDRVEQREEGKTEVQVIWSQA